MITELFRSFQKKLFDINWLLPVLILMIGGVGVAMIFAATNGVWTDGAQQHLIRLCLAMAILVGVAIIDIRVWYHLAYPIYFVALIMLLGVDLYGVEVNNSQRWLRVPVLGMRFQPSEVMKLAIVMALARYYHDLPKWRTSDITGIIGALVLIALPMQFIFRQPDLGTTLLLVATGLTIIFLAGINWRIIGIATFAGLIALPFIIRFGLKPYQVERIMTFIDPSRDPSDAGYHITQSKIALGSGGMSGKGYLNGTQTQLEYVPENSTDFIFTVIGEEFGFIGSSVVIALYILLLAICVRISLETRHHFSKLLGLGITTTFALYVFINLGMVTGLTPVVGVPLPLISYGGTVMLTVMIGFGLILSADLHRHSELPREGR